MTTDEAAKKWGRSRSSIVKMIEEGRIPAQKIRRDGEKSRWDIPDDAKYPEVQTLSTTAPSASSEKRTLARLGERGYIAKYAGVLSIKHMAQFLGVSCDHVRSIYDEIEGGSL